MAEILTSAASGLARITLNRPVALHAPNTGARGDLVTQWSHLLLELD